MPHRQRQSPALARHLLAVDEVLDVGALDEMRERHAIEKIVYTPAQLLPELTRERFISVAMGLPEPSLWCLNAADNVGDGDRGGWARQPIPAVGPARGFHQARTGSRARSCSTEDTEIPRDSAISAVVTCPSRCRMARSIMAFTA